MLYILTSTCELMSNNFIPKNLKYAVVFVQELDYISSVELFLKNSGIQECSAEEVHSLIKKHPVFDWSQILPDLSEEEQTKICELSTLRADPKKRMQVMAAHDLFQRANGNPFSITMLAN